MCVYVSRSNSLGLAPCDSFAWMFAAWIGLYQADLQNMSFEVGQQQPIIQIFITDGFLLQVSRVSKPFRSPGEELLGGVWHGVAFVATLRQLPGGLLGLGVAPRVRDARLHPLPKVEFGAGGNGARPRPPLDEDGTTYVEPRT